MRVREFRENSLQTIKYVFKNYKISSTKVNANIWYCWSIASITLGLLEIAKVRSEIPILWALFASLQIL